MRVQCFIAAYEAAAPNGESLLMQKVNGQLEKTAGLPSQCLAQQGPGG